MQFRVQVNVYRAQWEAVRASVEAIPSGDLDRLQQFEEEIVSAFGASWIEPRLA